MAEIQPLRAVHHALDRVPSLSAVIAPPYDVSDPVIRARLLARTPLNIVAADLPDPDRPDDHGDPAGRYAHAAELLREWADTGVLVRDERPALWALEQRFPGPDGTTLVRRGLFARTRVTDYGAGRIRPHERTHPAAVEDRLELTRATRANLSPVFALHDDAGGEVAALLAPVFATPPVASAVDDEGTEDRLWRIGNPAVVAALREALAGRELLIADGHHRYEASRRYAAERGGEGEHHLALVLLVAMQDDGLVIQPTHRLVRGLTPAARAALDALLARAFDVTSVAPADLAPPAGDGPFTLGLLDRGGPGGEPRARRAVLRDPAVADAAMPPDVPAPYRRLDTAVLQHLVLTRTLGLSQDAIDRRDGLGYARNDEEARELVADGTYELALFVRPCAVEQVLAVAQAGATMPAKSTSFAPKVPTGLLLSPLG
ncbi:DUF1015 domain-containing protein [Paraconexibacter antarcticus]|uniref:DUF1015 domain-containing protein n=1 Tax=Paraconexibacter antarcticus TaxID=2949664 RepID=A0ABY5E2K8_9ACTN|nr:DUF1015 domain-containing protein [Paraconexibacter antarcticus]UTI67035.1 DUF1015 domain-containing protein [Paraconexibacter antarcticus]